MSCCDNSKPLICCGGKGGAKPKDGWYCGCGCLNGPVQITFALIFVFLGFWFSLAALGDCKFAVVDNGYFPTIPIADGLFDGATGIRRGVGFVTFEGFDGTCYWYDSSLVDDEAVARDYLDFLGNGWNTGRATAAITTCLSLITWVYMWSFVCSSQGKAIRYIIGASLCVVLVILQGLTFTVLSSSWCNDFNCELSRSSGLSIGALLCFFFGGLSMFFTRDYSGPDGPVVVATKGEEVQDEEEPKDEENPEQALVEEEEEKSVKNDDEDAEDAAPEEEAVPEEQQDGSNIEGFEVAVGDQSTEIEA